MLPATDLKALRQKAASLNDLKKEADSLEYRIQQLETALKWAREDMEKERADVEELERKNWRTSFLTIFGDLLDKKSRELEEYLDARQCHDDLQQQIDQGKKELQALENRIVEAEKADIAYQHHIAGLEAALAAEPRATEIATLNTKIIEYERQITAMKTTHGDMRILLAGIMDAEYAFLEIIARSNNDSTGSRGGSLIGGQGAPDIMELTEAKQALSKLRELFADKQKEMPEISSASDLILSPRDISIIDGLFSLTFSGPLFDITSILKIHNIHGDLKVVKYKLQDLLEGLGKHIARLRSLCDRVRAEKEDIVIRTLG